MAEPESSSSVGRRCAQCGAELPGNVTPELCPKCLLKLGLGARPQAGPAGTVALDTTGSMSRGLPQPGEQLGHYRIIRPLGGGGMGVVFEAEDLENGRRVALKVLSQMLDSPEARRRFFREGRLAASINHPNSVYVFGTEEIGGTPVIAMELVAGGTLEERVRRQGPMPPAKAVDAVLQVIAGLDAAQRIGILHRDIKPSNCFVDDDGTVKVGDFGLSISTAVRTEPTLTATGSFLGTPAFCSPEQLRGEELNMRSDIYSVGATLFYLLTGQMPFEAKNVVALIATVLEQPAPSPRKLRRGVPQGLAKAVRRCLERVPSERFKSYEELRRVLAPYGSSAPVPATLGLRFLAGALDLFILSLLSMLIFMPAVGNPLNFWDFAVWNSWKICALALAGFGGSVLYYTLLEGSWGATAGKAICRLRVVGPDRNPPGFGRAFGRAAVYVLLPVLPIWAVYGRDPKAYLSGSTAAQYVTSFAFYLALGLLFCTARRRNGLAAVQDLITKTRVILRGAVESRPVLSASEAVPLEVESRPMVGPYHALETLEEFDGSAWLLGYDLRLLRKAWIRTVPTGTPPVEGRLRNLGRVGRLRWLTGRRSPGENWDAFEAVTGQSLVSLIRNPQPWSQVRYWLADLADEIKLAEKEGTVPPVLELDRVWITAEGRAKLLDFAAPGSASATPINPATTHSSDSLAGEPPPMPRTGGIPRFLGEIATAALEGQVQAAGRVPSEIAVRLPLHARDFLKTLPQLLEAEAVGLALRPLLRRAAEVSRWRRAALVGGCVAFPIVAALGLIFGYSVMQQWNKKNPGLMDLLMLLQQRSSMHFWTAKAQGPTDNQLAIYIAGHYGPLITNQSSWSSAFSLALIKGEARRFAEQSVAEHRATSESQLAEADAAVNRYLPKSDVFDLTKQPSFPLLVASLSLAIYVGLPALIAALLFRGGLVLRIAGVIFVRRDGARASRLRVFWRAVVVWSPLGFALFFAAARLMSHVVWAGWAAAGVVCALAGFSLALPERGLPDRLAGTWPVLR